ncbi:MAG: sugar ABC transporter permease [Ruthenibacterium sp.]
MKQITRKKLNSQQTMILITLLSMGIFYLVFMIIPILYAFAGSFCTWNPMIQQMDFAGLENYKTMLSSPVFYKAIVNTLIFTAVVTFFRVLLGMVLAVLIDDLRYFKSFFRSVYFLPVVASMVAISLVWVWIFEPTSGIMNQLLHAFGLPALGWLKDQHWSLIAIMIATIWKDVGFAMVFYLAGLNNISPSLYEAANVDGATRLQRFFHIQLPMLMPTTVLVSVTGVIGYIQMFDQVFMMTDKAGPNNATITAVYMLYEEAFINYRFGNASVIAIVVFLLTLGFSIMQMKMEKD